MTVKELINELLNCNMWEEVKVESFGDKKDIEEIEYDDYEREFIIKLKGDL